MALTAPNAIYNTRRRRNRLAVALAIGATAFGLLWLVFILAELLFKGLAKRLPREPGPSGLQSAGGAVHPGDQILIQRHLHGLHGLIISL